MKIQILPKTMFGKLSISLALLFIVLMYLKVSSGSIVRIPFPTLGIAFLGVIGSTVGLVSFIKNKDRSLLTLLSIIIGLLIILWVAAEIAFPH